jgi:predicted glycoside hydrolase/deacetylase ChbG (UPF0249 family)
LEFLGYPPGARVLILHADDVGVSHASNEAAFAGLRDGSLTCASALVPDPWFAETARLAAAMPGADIGIHMTLTAEYEFYRWRSVSGRAALHAPDGGMWRNEVSVRAHVSPEDAAAELRAQVELALAMGVDVTHLDTHMRSVLLPEYLPAYVGLAIEFRLPIFFFRPSERRVAGVFAAAKIEPKPGELARAVAVHAEQSARLEALGWPMVDNTITKTLGEIAPEDKDARFRQFFDELRPGLTHFICHPAFGGDEMAAMAPNDWRHRGKEAEMFASRDLREYAESLGIILTGYREIRDRLRARLGAKAAVR